MTLWQNPDGATNAKSTVKEAILEHPEVSARLIAQHSNWDIPLPCAQRRWSERAPHKYSGRRSQGTIATAACRLKGRLQVRWSKLIRRTAFFSGTYLKKALTAANRESIVAAIGLVCTKPSCSSSYLCHLDRSVKGMTHDLGHHTLATPFVRSAAPLLE
jgi:hypothetical protein